MNKRGQFSGDVVKWIIALIVLALLALAIWGFYQYSESIAEGAPKPSEAVIQGCRTDAQANFVESYCYNFRSWKDDYYTNCQNEDIQQVLISLDVDVNDINGLCNLERVEREADLFCENEISEGRRDSVEVQEKLCSFRLSALE